MNGTPRAITRAGTTTRIGIIGIIGVIATMTADDRL